MSLKGNKECTLLLMLVTSVSVVQLMYFMRKWRVSGRAQWQNCCNIRSALYLEETYISYLIIYTEVVTMYNAYFKVK